MESIRKWLETFMLTERGYTPGPELDKRITALRAMSNWRSMSLAQFREAMTIAHFPQYFADAISRSFYTDYLYQTGSWPNYTFADTAPDFRDISRFRMTEPGTLVRRRELQNAAETNVAEDETNYGVEEYARRFTISWQTIINDDLGKLQQTPARMANSAARWLDAFVSALYDNATSQASLVALGAVYSGTGRLTSLNLAVGLNAMRQRVDAGGNLIQINRIFLVIPPILEIQASTILDSALLAGIATNDINVIPRFLAGVFIDPYIATTALSVPWYLFADPAEIPGVSVARLQGFPGPITYQKLSDISLLSGSVPAAFLLGNAEHGEIAYFVEDIIGGWDDATWVGITDFQALYYSDGTAP